MGILDDLLFDIMPTPVLFGRRARRVLHHGVDGVATVTGIEVERSGEEEASEGQYRYALDVRVEARTFTCGVRQRLFPRAEEAHVGAQVPVVVRGRAVVIDWEQQLGTPNRDVHVSPWRMVRPPAPGVLDRYARREQKKIAQSRPATATVLTAAHVSTAFGQSTDLDVQISLAYPDGAVEQRKVKLRPPAYARHFAGVGVTLPVGVDAKDELRVDWQAAANGGAGFDASPPAVDPDIPDPPSRDVVVALFGALTGLAERAGEGESR